MWGQKTAAKQAEEIARMMAKKEGKALSEDSSVNATTNGSGSKSAGSPPAVVVRVSDDESSSFTDSVDDKASCKTLAPVLPLQKAEAHLKRIQAWVEVKSKREKDLYELMDSHKELAKARYFNDNNVGAKLSMKRVLKLKHERDQLVLALDRATEAIMEIKTAMDQAKTTAAVKRATAESSSPKQLWYKVDIGAQNANILSELESLMEDVLQHEVGNEEIEKALKALS